jgi:hypothetical protein
MGSNFQHAVALRDASGARRLTDMIRTSCEHHRTGRAITSPRSNYRNHLANYATAIENPNRIPREYAFFELQRLSLPIDSVDRCRSAPDAMTRHTNLSRRRYPSRLFTQSMIEKCIKRLDNSVRIVTRFLF